MFISEGDIEQKKKSKLTKYAIYYSHASLDECRSSHISGTGHRAKLTQCFFQELTGTARTFTAIRSNTQLKIQISHTSCSVMNCFTNLLVCYTITQTNVHS